MLPKVVYLLSHDKDIIDKSLSEQRSKSVRIQSRRKSPTEKGVETQKLIHSCSDVVILGFGIEIHLHHYPPNQMRVPVNGKRLH